MRKNDKETRAEHRMDRAGLLKSAFQKTLPELEAKRGVKWWLAT